MTTSRTLTLDTSGLTDNQRRQLRTTIIFLQGEVPSLCRLPELLLATDPEFVRVRLVYRDRPAGWPEDLDLPGWYGKRVDFLKRARQEGHVDRLQTARQLVRQLESDAGALLTCPQFDLLRQLLPAQLYEKI